MFNDYYSLTQAVIDEIKDLTRRAVLQKHIDAYDAYEEYCDTVCFRDCGAVRQYTSLESFLIGEGLNRYKVGEIVAVAQNYKDLIERGDCTELNDYIRDEHQAVYDALGYEGNIDIEEQAAWRNKMFVKSELMPQQIKILSVRVEKLQDISDEDILREGIVQIHELDSFYFECKERDEGFYFDTPKEAFASLIDKVGKKGDWEKNPYVWRYEFELIK